MHKNCKKCRNFFAEQDFFCTFAPEIQKRTIMLKKFAVTNFRGFANRIEWDLSHPSNYEFNDYAIKNGIIKNAIIYGPNGAGKSNFGYAIFDIVNHLTQKNKQPDYYVNFPYAGALNKPVVFEYTFRFGDNDIYYIYSKNRSGKLISEKLLLNSKVMFEKTDSTIHIDDIFSVNESSKNNLLSNNANQVSVISFLLTNVPLPQNHFLILLDNFVNSMLWFRRLDDLNYIGLQTGVTQIEEYIIKHDYVEDFASFLKEVSGQVFKFKSPKHTDKQLECIIDGKASIPFYIIESTGTKNITLLYYWLKNLSQASLVFIDEFDAFYHFKLAYEVCKRLFKYENCQVFMTSHNTYLMTNDLLRPDCNFILDQNIIKPLCECTEKELRFGHNIEKIYKSGAFHVN